MGSFVEEIKSLKVHLPEDYVYAKSSNMISWGDTLWNMKLEESFCLDDGFFEYAVNATEILSKTDIHCTMLDGSNYSFCAVDSFQTTKNLTGQKIHIAIRYNDKFVEILNSSSFFHEQVFWAIHIGIRSAFTQRLWAVKSQHDQRHVHFVYKIPLPVFFKALYPDLEHQTDYLKLWNENDGAGHGSLRSKVLTELKHCSNLFEGDEEWFVKLEDGNVVINEFGDAPPRRDLGAYVSVQFYKQYTDYCNELGESVSDRIEKLLRADMAKAE